MFFFIVKTTTLSFLVILFLSSSFFYLVSLSLRLSHFHSIEQHIHFPNDRQCSFDSPTWRRSLTSWLFFSHVRYLNWTDIYRFPLKVLAAHNCVFIWPNDWNALQKGGGKIDCWAIWIHSLVLFRSFISHHHVTIMHVRSHFYLIAKLKRCVSLFCSVSFYCL